MFTTFVLANLLPGLRDLRAPLSAGYLWLAAGWLYFAPQIPASVNEAQGVLKDIYRVLASSSPVALAAVLTFAAYIVGILSTGLLSQPTRILLRAAFIAGLVVIAPLGIAIIFLGESWKWLNLQVVRAGDEIEKLVGRHYASPGNRARSLVVRRISSIVLKDETCRNTLLDAVSRNLDSVLKRWEGKAAWVARHRKLENPALPAMTKIEVADQVRGSLLAGIKMGSRHSADILVSSVVDVERHVNEILDELKLVPERIVSDKPATYERWDRLSAESDFRQAIVPPLFGILVVLVIRGAFNWPFWLIGMVIPLVIFVQGISKEHAADGQLMQTLEAGVLKTESMERLMTGDLYLK